MKTWLIWLVLLASIAHADPVQPPIERVLTDTFGRTVSGRITALSAQTIDFERTSDQTRFSLPLKTLSEPDQAFAAQLLEKITASRSLPETPLLAAIRRDFQTLHPTNRRLVPVAADAYATARIFVIGVQDIQSLAHAFDGGFYPDAPVSDQARVLWISVCREFSLFELASAKLPPGHATIKYDVQQTAIKRGRELQLDYLATQRNQDSDPFAPRSNSLSLSPEQSLAQFLKNLRKTMPLYWTDYSAHFDTGENYSHSPTRFTALWRDGTPITFRTQPLAGPLHVVMTILRDHSTELK